ncbi:MAG: hypothetical protein FWD98_04725, partial [Defluviitaleaceae bacterium]|nr:hypothetical protein [Defluviitaleaceae bacterium]
MRLQYIFGGSGSGKTRRCLEEITRAAQGGTQTSNLLYIVPEQFTLESERLLCECSPRGAIVLPQVLSFQRLCYHTFSKTGKLRGKLLDEIGKKMLLQKLLLRHGAELKFFAQAAEQEGFVDICERAFREFAMYGQTPGDLLRCAQAVSAREGERSIPAYKLADIARLYELYTSYVSERYIITEQAANFVPDKLADSELLAGARVWIDGFTGFTAQEYGIIGGLLRKAEQVSVVLCFGEGGTSYPSIAENDPMAQIKFCVTRITELARTCGAEVARPVILAEKHRFAQSPALAFLEKHYLDYDVHTFDDAPAGISAAGAYGKHDEAAHAAGYIVRLVREHGLRYSDIAVVCANPKDYEREIAAAFSANEIPHFLDVRHGITLHPLSQMLCSAANVPAYDFRHEDVIAFLKTGLTDMSRDDVDLLENYTLKMGIRGSKWRVKLWARGFEDGRFHREKLNALRKRVVDMLAPFAGKFKRGRPAPVGSYAVRLFDMLEKMGVPERGLADPAYMQVLAKLVAVLEKMVEIMGEEEVTPDMFAKILQVGVKSADMGIIPPTLDQVIVGSAERTRLPRIAALVVLGANDGILPAKKEEDALLTDSERAGLNALGVELAPDSRRQSLQGPF